MSAVVIDQSDILRTIKIFHQPGDVVEIRIPNANRNGTISGYYDNDEAFGKDIENLVKKPYSGYYFTLNQVDPALIARANNRYRENVKITTADKDITHLLWLPIDL